MKMKVVLDREAIIALINETVSKTVGQPMVVSHSYEVSSEVELEPADVVAARKRTEPEDVDVPRLTTELSSRGAGSRRGSQSVNRTARHSGEAVTGGSPR